MLIKDIRITGDDLDRCGWQQAVVGCGERTYHAYFPALSARAKEADAAGDVRSRDALHLLAAAMMLDLREDNAEPFGPLIEMGGRRTPITADFTTEHLEAIAAVAPTIGDPELQARVSDIVWVRKHDRRAAFEMAKLAVDAYLASARVLEDPQRWPLCFDRIRRAQQIAASLGRNSPLPKVLAFIEEMLQRYNGTDPSFLSCKLMELLQEMGKGDPSTYAPIAETAAQRAEQERDWWRAKAYLMVLARWYARAGDSESEQAAWRRYAETFVQEAEDALARPASGYSVASHFLQQAIEAYRNHVRDSRERQEELHRLLLDYQQRSVAELKRSSVSVDATDLVTQSEQAVADKPLVEALFTLALMVRPTSKLNLAKMVERHERDFISRIFPRVILSDQGKVVARQPSPLGEGEDAAAAREAEMLHLAVTARGLVAQGVIWPAIGQIMREHAVGMGDVLPLLHDTPFIPFGREGIVARGLIAGLHGDLLVAMHLLIPQVEHAIRQLLTQVGVITSGLTSEGIQQEVSLDQLLLKPELERFLDADTIFELRGLLVEKHGSNLRNLMAHGLLDEAAFSSGEALYLWWLVLRLCCLPLVSVPGSQQQVPADEEPHAPSAGDAADNGGSRESLQEPNDDGGVGMPK